MPPMNQMRRLRRIESAIDRSPVMPDVLQGAIARFQATGALPDEMPVARAVIHHVTTGSSPFVGTQDGSHAILQPARHADPVLHRLYAEALHGGGTLSRAARDALKHLAELDLDVTNQAFADGGKALPDWGTAGIHILGVPEALARPPYEAQAARLFEHYASLRKRVPQQPGWFAHLGRCVSAFRATGELPGDGLLQEAVLADAEMIGLLKNALGQDVSVLMAALDLVATTHGKAREAAIAAVQGLAAAGHFAPLEAPQPSAEG